MTPSALSPCPVRAVTPGEQVIVSHCKKCGNEIRLAVTGLTREQVENAVDIMDGQSGECPGGYHIELSGWRKMWDLDAAIAKFYATAEGSTGYQPVPTGNLPVGMAEAPELIIAQN